MHAFRLTFGKLSHGLVANNVAHGKVEPGHLPIEAGHVHVFLRPFGLGQPVGKAFGFDFNARQSSVEISKDVVASAVNKQFPQVEEAIAAAYGESDFRRRPHICECPLIVPVFAEVSFHRFQAESTQTKFHFPTRGDGQNGEEERIRWQNSHL